MEVKINIENYKLYPDKLFFYYDNQSNVLYTYDYHNHITEHLRIKGTSHWFFEDECYVRNFQGLCAILEKGGFKNLRNEYVEIISNIGVAVNYTNSDGRTHKETLFKLPEEKQILSGWLPNNIYHIQNQYWINDTEKDLKLIDADKGEILWTIPQPEVVKPYGYSGLTNTKKILGIYKENIWIQLPDSRLWALDIATGKVNHEIEHEFFCVHQDTVFLETQSGEIIIFGFDLYACFDLNQLTMTKEFILPDTIRITKSIFIKTNIIGFTGRKEKTPAPNIYGIFNRETLSFEYIGGQEEENGFFYQTPQVNDELFTILDSEGNLIIHKLNDILKSPAGAVL